MTIEQTEDEGHIVLGYTNSDDGDVTGHHGYEDIWLVKLNKYGNVQWSKSIGGSLPDKASFMQRLNMGKYMIIGYTMSNDGDAVGNHGNEDVWVIEFQEDGQIVQKKCFGGQSTDIGGKIIQMEDGGYIILSLIYSRDGDVSDNHGISDIWIVKTDDLLGIEWEKCLGGGGSEGARGVQVGMNGGYVIFGTTNSRDIPGYHAGWMEIFVVKIDENGVVQWQKCLGGSGWDDVGVKMFQTDNGGYVIFGYSDSNDGDIMGNHGAWDVCILRLK